MIVARGKTREILRKVGEIQNLAGKAEMNHHNDKDQMSHVVVTNSLKRIQELCIDITSFYAPID